VGKQVLWGLLLGVVYCFGRFTGGTLRAAPVNGGQMFVCSDLRDRDGFQFVREFLNEYPNRRIVTVFPTLKPHFQGMAMPDSYCIVHEPVDR
jgi:hypothetical protein